MSAPDTLPPKVFIGSSSEALAVCKYLQSELQRNDLCLPRVWDQGVFTASSYTLDALADAARTSDFAILVASPDDAIALRDEMKPAPRDNVVFELGLFVGALGRERTFIVADRTDPGLRLPTDLLGVTYLPYKRPQDGNWRGALTDAVLGISERIVALGYRHADSPAASRGEMSNWLLDAELDFVCNSAIAQGWKVKTRSATTIRLESPRGRRHTFTLGPPAATRVRLRDFVSVLRADGLRISRAVRQPVDESPLG